MWIVTRLLSSFSDLPVSSLQILPQITIGFIDGFSRNIITKKEGIC